jgi:coatomer subunit alpha
VLAAVGGAGGTPSAAAAAAHSAAAAAAAASVLTAAAEREAQAAAAAKKAALIAAHGGAGAASAAASSSLEDETGVEGGGGWGDEGDLDLGLDEKKAASGGGAEAGAWGDDLDLGLDEADMAAAAASSSSSASASASKAGSIPGGWAPPAGGTSTPAYWVANSTLAADHVAAGSFETAMTLLNRQIGAVNFQPLKTYFTQVYQAARVSVPGSLPGLPSLTAYLHRNEQDLAPPKDHSLPVVAITLPVIQEKLRALYKHFTDGKFSDAAATCDALFALIPLLVVNTKAEVAEVKAIVAAVTEYKLACRIMMMAKSTDPNDGTRQIELSAYMTHCALEPPHLMLAVNLAMAMAFKHKNFIHAAGFARRLLEMPDINSAKNAQLLTRVS